MLKRLAAFFLDIIEVIVFAGAIFLFIYLLVLQPHKIKGGSMLPGFVDGEYLLTDKVTYRFKEPQRGDVVVFEAPTGQGEEFIKRILGLPGETVMIKNGNFYVDGKLVSEDYLAEETITAPSVFLGEGVSKKVPIGEYFVMGDNRSHSSDSRSWGFVTKDKITGRAWLTYWPLGKAGVIEKVSYR